MNALLVTLISMASSWTIASMNVQAPVATNKLPEHQCCHNGKCCGALDCCTLDGCQSKDCPTRK